MAAQLTPKRLGLGSRWQEVAAGTGSSCALRGDGQVWCWGDSAFGQLGTSDLIGGPLPRQVLLARGAKALSLKFNHACAVLDDGSLWCWGDNFEGQFGLGDFLEEATGMSRTTIRAGRDELRAGIDPTDVVNVRRTGGGRPPIEETHPDIVPALEALVDPVTRGDPESPLRWTSKSTRKLAEEPARHREHEARRLVCFCPLAAGHGHAVRQFGHPDLAN